jgi:hypothetical protein
MRRRALEAESIPRSACEAGGTGYAGRGDDYGLWAVRRASAADAAAVSGVVVVLFVVVALGVTFLERQLNCFSV